MKYISHSITLFLLLCTCLVNPVFASTSWTHIVMIPGNRPFDAPSVPGAQKIKLQDDARVFFNSMVHQAQSDSRGTYLIVYDPFGTGYWLTNKHLYIELYHGGKKLYQDPPDEKVDVTPPEFYDRMAQALDRYTPDWRDGMKSFIFFGEYVPVRPVLNYDWSFPSSPFSRDLLFDGIKRLLKDGDTFDVVYFQTCYMNTVDFLSKLAEISKEAVLPRDSVPRWAFDWSFLNDVETPDSYVSGIQAASKNSTEFDLVSYHLKDFDWSGLEQDLDNEQASPISQELLGKIRELCSGQAQKPEWLGTAAVACNDQDVEVGLSVYAGLLQRLEGKAPQVGAELEQNGIWISL